MKLTKEKIESAKRIREKAAVIHGCEISEIDWPSCVGMAMRGETLLDPAQETFEFEIDIKGEPRKGGVYVAKIVGKDDTWGLGRVFYELESAYDRNEKTVWGTIECSIGDIVEVAVGGSWKNRYRYAYECVPMDEEYHAFCALRRADGERHSVCGKAYLKKIGNTTAASTKKAILKKLSA